MRTTVRVILGTVAVIAMAASADATTIDFISGFGWVTTEAIANSLTGGSPASLLLATCHNGLTTCTTGNADVTFTTTGIGFNTGFNHRGLVGFARSHSTVSLTGYPAI